MKFFKIIEKNCVKKKKEKKKSGMILKNVLLPINSFIVIND